LPSALSPTHDHHHEPVANIASIVPAGGDPHPLRLLDCGRERDMGGTIILLNGTASAGKTSIGHAIQRLADRPWLLLGADILGAIVPPPYNNGDRAATGFAWQSAGPDAVALVAGPWGQSVIAAWHRAIATLAQAGQDVVVDHILQEPGWFADCVAAWQELPVLFVGVRCPLAVAAARAARRPGRTPGYVRWAYGRVHTHGPYDIEVDTNTADPDTCARRILDRLGRDTPFTAFPPQASA
jgi:chloramphenicol 3-O phosphotransferase